MEYETGERELYSLRKDPYEMSNVARHAAKSLLRAHAAWTRFFVRRVKVHAPGK